MFFLRINGVRLAKIRIGRIVMNSIGLKNNRAIKTARGINIATNALAIV